MPFRWLKAVLKMKKNLNVCWNYGRSWQALVGPMVQWEIKHRRTYRWFKKLPYMIVGTLLSADVVPAPPQWYKEKDSFDSFFFYWNIVDLQCCVSFRCTAKWFSYTYIYIFFLRFFSLKGYYKILSIIPCAIQ